MPMFVADSIQPGVTILSAASITFAPAGTCTSAPTAVIFPPAITIVPRSIAGPDTVRIRAFVIAATGSDPNPLSR